MKIKVSWNVDEERPSNFYHIYYNPGEEYPTHLAFTRTQLERHISTDEWTERVSAVADGYSQTIRLDYNAITVFDFAPSNVLTKRIGGVHVGTCKVTVIPVLPTHLFRRMLEVSKKFPFRESRWGGTTDIEFEWDTESFSIRRSLKNSHPPYGVTIGIHEMLAKCNETSRERLPGVLNHWSKVCPPQNFRQTLQHISNTLLQGGGLFVKDKEEINFYIHGIYGGLILHRDNTVSAHT